MANTDTPTRTIVPCCQTAAWFIVRSNLFRKAFRRPLGSSENQKTQKLKPYQPPIRINRSTPNCCREKFQKSHSSRLKPTERQKHES
ncbi:hypothetical protein [Neisseria sicca]